MIKQKNKRKEILKKHDRKNQITAKWKALNLKIFKIIFYQILQIIFNRNSISINRRIIIYIHRILIQIPGILIIKVKNI